MSALAELSAAFPDRDEAELARVIEAHDGRGDLAVRALLAEALGTSVEDADPPLESAHARADHLADHLAGTDADPTLSPRARVDVLDFSATASASARHPLGEAATPPRSPPASARATSSRRSVVGRPRATRTFATRTRPTPLFVPHPSPRTPTRTSPRARARPTPLFPGLHPADEIARGWEALRGPLAALFLDEPAPRVQRQVAAMANKSNRHARHARAGTSRRTPARRRAAASRPVGPGPIPRPPPLAASSARSTSRRWGRRSARGSRACGRRWWSRTKTKTRTGGATIDAGEAAPRPAPRTCATSRTVRRWRWSW